MFDINELWYLRGYGKRLSCLALQQRILDINEGKLYCTLQLS